jgi:energy-coupling factor transporter ATP-binding protein EcfA2
MGLDGELYTRDLAALQDFLATHLDEVHFWLSSFRDVTPTLATKKIQEKNYRHTANQTNADAHQLAQQLQQVTEELAQTADSLQQDESLLKLNRNRSGLLQRYLPGKITHKRRRLQELKSQKKRLDRQLASQDHLEREYLRKAEATCLLFTYASNIQAARNEADFTDALHSVVKEVSDVHNYQIKQKLEGGKLRVYTEEVNQPGISLLTRWAGAALNPRQLSRLGPEFAGLSRAVEEKLMVFPQQDILLGGSVQDEKKLVSARVVRNFLRKLEVVPTAANSTANSPQSKMPIWIGNTCHRGASAQSPWELPFEKAGHMYLSGATGSGKSFLARVIVEGCLLYPEVGIIIFDPGNQWVGLLSPEDRAEVLARYGRFGLKASDARGFGFTYHGLGSNTGQPLPSDLHHLAKGRHIVSFKGLDEGERYSRSADIGEALFEASSRSESEKPGTLVGIEEVPNFLKKRASAAARSAAERTETVIDKIAREGRKYGLRLLLLSQSIRDFSRDIAVVRQNISTRVFMQNSDRELEYAAEFLDDSKAIAKLTSGEALVCNSEWGAVKLSIRPPLSKVWEPDNRQVRELVGVTRQAQPTLSSDAKAVVDAARQQYNQTGQPARLARIAQSMGITSRRKLGSIVQELQQAGVAEFRQLNERGKPLVIVPVGAHKPRTNRTEMRTETDKKWEL